MVTLVHFHLINSIMVGKKKTNDVQFYTEACRPFLFHVCFSCTKECSAQSTLLHRNARNLIA